MNKKFFSELPQDLYSDPLTSSEVVFNAFNTNTFDSTTIKNRDNYIKSLIKQPGFSKEISIDQVALDTFFVDNESATAKSAIYSNEERDEKLLEIRFIIHNLLPDFERDIMTLIYDYNKIQEDIGVILGLSQEMVNYYKKRAIHRILHFYHHRKIDVNDMRECLSKHVSKRQLEAMMLYFFRHNQRIISKELKISQSAVSARLKQGLKKLKRKSRHNKRVLKYYKIFNNLSKQKSLYSSQTRMTLVNDIDNYKQFDENNQRVSTSKDTQTEKVSKQKQKPKIKHKQSRKHKKKFKIDKILSKKSNKNKNKKIKFNRDKLKKARTFFKR